MALQVATLAPAEFRHNGALNMMVGVDELEEGEASEANDSNYGSDLYFPHLEDKLTEVLGHARKDFEGAIFAEKLGSKFGGYGTFLPTVPAGPPPASGPPPAAPPRVRYSPSTQPPALPPVPPGSSEAMKAQAIQAPEVLKVEEPKKTSSITLKIKVGSENRGKNSAIYNRLGFSSPSISEEDDEEMSGNESSPERSPTSMIQMILSHRLPTDGLLSPLPDFFSSPLLKSGSKTTTREVTKEAKKVAREVAKEVTKVKPQEKPSSSKKERESLVVTPAITSKKSRRDGEEAETSKKKLKLSSSKPEEKKKASHGKSKSHSRDEEPRSKSRLKPGVEPAAPTGVGAIPSSAPEPVVQPVSNLGVTGFANPETAVPSLSIIKENWVACDECKKWRLLPPTMDPPKQSDKWLCEMITWLPPGMNNCRFSEESTTAEVYNSLGIQYPPPQPDPNLVNPLVPAAPQPAAPATPLAPLLPVKKLEEPPPVKLAKPSKQVSKKKEKEKFKHQQQQPVEADVGKSSKKKRAPVDDNPTSSSKKVKTEEVKRLDDDVDSLERPGRKPSFKPDDNNNARSAKSREKKEQRAQAAALELPKAEEEQHRDEPKEARKSNDPGGKKVSRPEKPSKSSKSSQARVVDEAENQTKPRSSSRPHQDAKDQKRKLALGSCSPQVADSLDVFRSRAADSSAELRISDGGAGDYSNHDRKNDRVRGLDQRRASDDAELEPAACRAKQAIVEHRETWRKGVVDFSEARNEDRKENGAANLCIKAATSLKHTADRLKDETATDIYLQAGLKFLQGAELMVSSAASPLSVYNDDKTLGLYVDTAKLFKFCGTQYEKANDIPGAVLAFKCAAVSRFKLLMVKRVGMFKDRTDIETALNRAPAPGQTTPPTEESPSSSSASDLDNLNILTNSEKSAVSPLVQGSGTLPPTIFPSVLRYLRNSGDIFEALEFSSKADSLLASLGGSKVLSAEKLAAVDRVGGIGFNDVEALVRSVNQALEALGR